MDTGKGMYVTKVREYYESNPRQNEVVRVAVTWTIGYSSAVAAGAVGRLVGIPTPIA